MNKLNSPKIYLFKLVDVWFFHKVIIKKKTKVYLNFYFYLYSIVSDIECKKIKIRNKFRSHGAFIF